MNSSDPRTTDSWVERVLNRESAPDWSPAIPAGPWMITGGLGSLGTAMYDLLAELGATVYAFDIDDMDVTSSSDVAGMMAAIQPAVVLHMAGAKHAPEGETDPMHCVKVNTIGTRNVLTHAPQGARVVTASTCKACDPETAYGASKLIAERLTLNAGQRVARFHNVVETSGNVFEIWRNLADDAPLPVTDGTRYFISRAEALALTLYAATSPFSGRWCVNPRRPQRMTDIAARLYPGRATIDMSRRGDRLQEPLIASNEDTMRVVGTQRIMQVVGTHDPARQPVKATVAA